MLEKLVVGCRGRKEWKKEGGSALKVSKQFLKEKVGVTLDCAVCESLNVDECVALQLSAKYVLFLSPKVTFSLLTSAAGATWRSPVTKRPMPICTVHQVRIVSTC